MGEATVLDGPQENPGQELPVADAEFNEIFSFFRAHSEHYFGWMSAFAIVHNRWRGKGLHGMRRLSSVMRCFMESFNIFA